MTHNLQIAISNFSAIREATVELAPFTVIIGPQASGKSVVSKLAYFCQSLSVDLYQAAESGHSLDDAKGIIAQKFNDWFPVSAWGTGKFEIQFGVDGLYYRFARSVYAKKVKNSVKITLPFRVQELYEEFAASIKGAPSREQRELSGLPEWRWYQQWNDRIGKVWGRSFVEFQLFVPAGRSFFTSIGKAVAAFEQSGLLDPLTVSFGRRFASLRDRQFRSFRNATSLGGSRMKPLYGVLGGNIVYDRNKEYIEASDGRRVPFNTLSSGQQELIPLIAVLEALPHPMRGRQVVYIEEPEAHLFPTAQSTLVEVLASLVNSPELRAHLVMTTHSPYMLAKLNNLILAGSLARSARQRAAEIDSIVPQDSRLKPGCVRAYAIVDGIVNNLLGTDGIISADYLDEVSGDIGRQFSSLLAVERTDDA